MPLIEVKEVPNVQEEDQLPSQCESSIAAYYMSFIVFNYVTYYKISFDPVTFT